MKLSFCCTQNTSEFSHTAEKFDSTRCLFLAKGYNPVVPEIISRETVSTNEN